MRFRAFIRNENTSQATWFVYVAQENGQTIYAARFNSAHNAQRIADEMNDAWRAEGCFYIPRLID